MNYTKILQTIYSTGFFLLFLSFSYADSALTWTRNLTWSEIFTWNPSVLNCSTNKYKLVWPFDIKLWKIWEYSLKVSDENKHISPTYINYKLLKWIDVVDSFSGSKYSYEFVNTWDYVLQAKIVDQDGCIYLTNENVKTYKYIYMYIWDSFDEYSTFDDNFKQNNIVIRKILVSWKTFFSENEFLERLNENLFYLNNADLLIVDSAKFNNIFEQLWQFAKVSWTNFWEKRSYVITDLNQELLKRLLAKYLKNVWITKLNVLSKDNSLNFFSSLSREWESYFDANHWYIRLFNMSFHDLPKYKFFSFIIDSLIYNWFPSNLISLLLALSIAALIVSVFKQIIGFSVFSIYSPILFAVSMLVLWIKFSFILLLIAFLATSLTRLFTKKIYLLYSAKMSMLIILYILVTLVILWLDRFLWFNFIDYTIFSNSLILFPIIILIVVADKVFYEWFSIVSKSWLILFVEFLIVSICVYYIISSYKFQYFLLVYPETIIWVFLLNILVWRFTWLQLLEYFRFIPLIKNTLEEEEE